MKRKMSLYNLSFFFITIALLSGCSLSQKPILIGLVNTFESINGTLAYDSLHAVDIAVNQINDMGGIHGRKLELVIRNDEADAEVALAIGRELSEMGVIAVIGHGLSSVYEGIRTAAAEEDLIYISPTIATEAATHLDDNFFRVIPTTSQQGTELAKLVKNVNLADTFIVYEEQNIQFTSLIKESFTSELQSYGVIIDETMHVSFHNGDIEQYRDVMQQFNDSQYANLLMIGSSYDVGTMVQLIENRETKHIFLPVWPSTNDIFSFSGGIINGAYSINFIDHNDTSSNFVNFCETYQEEYDELPSFSSLFSYEAAIALFTALENANDLSTESIREALKGLTVSGLQDEFILDEYGDVERPIFQFQLIDNTFVRYEHDDA